MCLFISKWPFGNRKRCWIQVGPSTPEKYQIIFGTFWTNDRNPITNGLLVKLAYSVCWETCEIFCVFFRVPQKKKTIQKWGHPGGTKHHQQQKSTPWVLHLATCPCQLQVYHQGHPVGIGCDSMLKGSLWLYPSSHEHGNGKWLLLKGNDNWRFMGGRVHKAMFI